MPYSLTHQFVSAQPDSSDSGLISSDAWNDNHLIFVTGVGVLGTPNDTNVEIAGVRETTSFDGGLLGVVFPAMFQEAVLTNPLGIASGGSGQTNAVDALSALELDFTGTITFSAVDVTRSGFLKANGAAVSRTTYARLFARIGTTFGAGNGSTTFNLPDLRGEFIRGWDDGRGIDSGRVFGSTQTDENASHNHTVSGTTTVSGFHTHTFGSSHGGWPVGGPNAASLMNVLIESNNHGGFNVYASGFHGHNFSGTTGSSGNIEARPRNISMVAFIKY